ncbi:helix-turn-helix domain-containing protein [Vagococcus zengguangii]|uniref:Uncharacterized protein n=1 Tax=Vagococcus zengguangii TaxID=2571750 RepID=A0A4D7CSH3_9ENTE|nr:helix-turn-helix domain-containing protein [Vagococcus zengguangii]QCI85476.1 hypothetical protein FA707_00175 [Vagococcus zengguangii]TLG80021.1 hypothetical protein FE258_06730 [Vagococcus zengguangii]
MIYYLEKKEQTTYDVINFLYQQEYGTDVDAIATNTNLSIGKVSEILSELTHDFSLYFPDYDVREQFYRNSFNQVIKGSKFSIDLFTNMLLSRSIFCEFMMDLLHERTINHDIYAANRNISLSTVKREWRSLKDNLARHDIYIEKEQGFFKLKGNEEHMRYLFFVLIFYSNYAIPNYLTRADLQFYDNTILNNANEQSLRFLNIMLYTSLIRIKYGHLVSDEAEKHLFPDDLSSQEIFHNCFNSFYKGCKLPSKQLTRELNFLFFFSTILTLINIDTLSKMEANIPNNFFEDSLFPEINPIINEMTGIFNFKITPTEYFFLISNLSKVIRKKQVFGSVLELDIDFSGLNGFPKFVERLSNNLRQHPLIDTRHLFAIFYPILDKRKQPISILVASRLGTESQMLLQDKLQRFIQNDINFVHFMEEQPDIVVSDIFIDTKDTPCFLIKPYPTLKEIYRLSFEISKYINRDNILI